MADFLKGLICCHIGRSIDAKVGREGREKHDNFINSRLYQWQVISKFITCLVKLYTRCKSDVLKAKQSKDQAKTGRKGRKREESGVFASGPPHHFVNKFHNNRLLSGGCDKRSTWAFVKNPAYVLQVYVYN